MKRLFWIVAILVVGCAGGLSQIPIPTSVSVSESEAGTTICTTLAAKIQPLDAGTE
jgi:hypothetical protein